MWKRRHKSRIWARTQPELQAQRHSAKMHPSMPVQSYTYCRREMKFHLSESGTAASQVSWECIANCSYHPQHRKLLLLLNCLNTLKARWQQCHEIVCVIIPMCSNTFVSPVHVKQPKPNTDNCMVKPFSTRNGCWSHLSCLVHIQILMSKGEPANHWAGHCWIRNHIIVT